MKDIQNIVIVCHDAGGSEVISSWVHRNHLEKQCTFILEGPAVKIFQNKIANVACFNREYLSIAIEHCDWVLTGTGWSSDLEIKAIQTAKSYQKKVCSYLDHWGNYKERFILKDTLIYPDEIWVGDEDAYKIATKCFTNSKSKIQLVPNPYFMDIKDALSSYQNEHINKDGKINILYLCEPNALHSLRMENHPLAKFGYTELIAIDYFFSIMHKLLSRYQLNLRCVRIRPHPSENKNKYDDIISKYSEINSEISHSSFLDDCVWSDWVIGCSTMGLVLGLIAGKKVFSTIPPGGKVLCLPQKDIIRINTLSLS